MTLARAAGGGAAGLFTLLGSSWFSAQTHVRLPIVKINEDDSLLSHWHSEEYNSPPDTAPECRFWNMNVQYQADLCSHFTIGRTASTPTKARERALACAGAHGTECVLSPEIGLSIPAAFVFDSTGHSSVRMVIGPRLIPFYSKTQHVRVAPPMGDGLTDTRTFVFNSTIRVEYLDGATRRMITTELHDDAAFCVQLLRAAFEKLCWEKLD